MQAPATSEAPARADWPRLMLLALASLALAFGVELLAPICQLLIGRTMNVLGNYDVFVLQAASVLGLLAMLAGAAPAVLAEGHRLFRCALVAAHLLVAWAVQVGGYIAMLPADSKFVADICSSSLLGMLGVFTGLVMGLLVLSALWGWLLTRRAGDAARPTFSTRGIMIATAAAALLFASPRIVTPLVAGAVKAIYASFDLQPEWPTSVTVTGSSLDGIPIVVMSLLTGLVGTAMVASAMWLPRSRRGWLGLSTGAIAVGMLVFVAEEISGGPLNSASMAIASAASLFVASLQATLQKSLWGAFGWRLVRIRRGPPVPAEVAVSSPS